MTPPNRFEDRLLEELRQVVDERPVSGQPRRKPGRTRWALAGAACALTIAAAAIVASSGEVTPNAYAVQKQPDGTVAVSIKSLSDAGGLEEKLRQAGVPAVVHYLPGDQSACGVAVPPPGHSPALGTRAESKAGFQSFSGSSEGDRQSPLTQTITKTKSPQQTQSKLDGLSKEYEGEGGGPQSGPRPNQAPPVLGVGREAGSEGTTFKIDPSTLKPGEELHITTSSSSSQGAQCASISVRLGPS